MNAKVQKWGNSLAVRIPRALAEECDLSQGSAVEMRVVDGKLVVASQRPSPYKLEDLLAGVTEKNIHKEVPTGKPVGKEIL